MNKEMIRYMLSGLPVQESGEAQAASNLRAADEGLGIDIKATLDALHTQYQFKADAIVPRNCADAPTVMQLVLIREAHQKIIPILKALAAKTAAPVESVNQGLVDALKLFIKCAYPVAMEIDQRGYAWSTAYLDAALPIAKEALRAAESQAAPAFSEVVGTASKIIQDMPLDDYSTEEIATEIVEAFVEAGALSVREE